MIPHWVRRLVPVVAAAFTAGGIYAVAQSQITNLTVTQAEHAAKLNSLEQHEALHNVNESTMAQELKDLKEHLILDLGAIRDDLHEIRSQGKQK